MQGLKDLFASERGIFAIILSLSSTVLAILGRLTIEQWLSFNQWLGLTLIASKTVTTAVDSMLTARRAAPAPSASPATATIVAEVKP